MTTKQTKKLKIKVLDVEQYLNNTVAAQIYTKFGVLIRVHL
jgi:hypothetical protein